MRRYSLLSLAALLAACATATPPSDVVKGTVLTTPANGPMNDVSSMSTAREPASSTIEIHVPVDRTWSTLRTVYDTLAIPVGTVDATSRTIGTTGFRVRRRLGRYSLTQLMDCGSTQSGPNAENYEVNIAIATKLRTAPDGSGTTATTSMQAVARPISSSGNYVSCSSTGVLESRIGELLSALAR